MLFFVKLTAELIANKKEQFCLGTFKVPTLVLVELYGLTS
jgi:hypothetical protein